jgi:hypothetical protein
MREKQFYVSTDVYRAFWLLWKANKIHGVKSRNEIADSILHNYIGQIVESEYRFLLQRLGEIFVVN